MAKQTNFLARTWRDVNELFFVRRRPRWLGIPKEWEQPDEEAFEAMLQRDDFVSLADFPAEERDKHPIIMQDLADLKQYLVPTFYRLSQRSRHYQNLFYMYQWIFVLGAFLTTLFGTLATYNIAGPQEVVPTAAPVVEATAEGTAAAEGTADTSADQNIPGSTRGNSTFWAQTFSIFTAVIGAFTAFFRTLSNRSDPQKRWGNTRRLAEELRMHYYKYLSHQQPYNSPDRLTKLRDTVLKVKEQEYV
ncbi:MAG: DUF4231 domain-containing protein [Chloroflexi bacterium]|nr:DUF4231 domain-containing protein [Chloroflexota bacterium]